MLLVTLPQPVAPVAGLGEGVGTEAEERLGLHQLGDDLGIDVVGVEVVDDLGLRLSPTKRCSSKRVGRSMSAA
jgi:hypothetical protein